MPLSDEGMDSANCQSTYNDNVICEKPKLHVTQVTSKNEKNGQN
jgi:hypothetical protein